MSHATRLSFLLFLCAPARADLQDWLVEVAAGTPATYSDTNVAVPSVADIGTINVAGGATYEFIVNAVNTGTSSALMGARNTGVGNESAMKFEQWMGTGQFGMTEWGITDWVIAPNAENVDLHVTFVVDSAGSSSELYVDGVLVGTVAFAPHMTDMVGLGQWYDPNGSVDFLSGALHGVAAYDAMLPANEIVTHSDAYHDQGGPIGTNYCGPANLNSTGNPAVISASGSVDVVDNDVELTAALLPANELVYFITGTTQGFAPNPGGSQGNLCLGGPIGRHVAQIGSSGGQGEFVTALDLLQVPTPGGKVAVQPGESWYWQAWFSDNNPGPTFNFTDAVCITFQ